MPRWTATGPYSVTGDPVFPLPTRPQRLEAGDVLWIDSGINLFQSEALLDGVAGE